jgi:hypothetical protein
VDAAAEEDAVLGLRSECEVGVVGRLVYMNNK